MFNTFGVGGSIPAKLVAHVMLRLKFFEALMNMSRSRFCCKRNPKHIQTKYINKVNVIYSCDGKAEFRA